MGYGHSEHSYQALEKALQHSDGIELDVRQTKDKTIVLFHDSHLDAQTTSIGLINKTTSTNLKKARLLDGQALLTLNKALPLFKKHRHKTIILEIKDSDVAAKTATLLKKHHITNVEYSSFNPHTLLHLKTRNPHLTTYLTYIPIPRYLGFLKLHHKSSSAIEPLTIAFNKYQNTPANTQHLCFFTRPPRHLLIDGINIPIFSLTPAIAEQTKKRNLKLLVFAVNDEQNYHYCKNLQADAIITDRPRTLRKK